MHTTATPPKAILGIDVSKNKLDLHLIPDEAVLERKRGSGSQSLAKAARHTFSNSAVGLQKLLAWIERKGIEQAHVCLEPTSTYHELAFETLSDHGHWVSVTNARLIRSFAHAMNLINKTDGIDACVIAEFCRNRRPARSMPLTEAGRSLRELSRRRTALVQHEQKERNRLETTRTTLCIASLKRSIKALTKEREKIEAALHQLIQQNDELRTQSEQYQSIKGIGKVVSATILAELHDLPQFESAKQAVAYVGLAPRKHESGSSLHRSGGISKRGNSRLRAVLYMAALNGMKTDPVLKAFADRLRNSVEKKKPKVIVVAVMRKMVHLLYGIAKSGHPRRLPATI
jgi:transposase